MPNRAITIVFVSVIVVSAVMPIACARESSAREDTTRPVATLQPSAAAIGGIVACQFRYRATHARYALTECEPARPDARVRFRMEWATENGWGARASQPGVRGDCVAVFGWATEAQYLFTSAEHRGAGIREPSCDGSESTAFPHSWVEYVQGMLESALGIHAKGIKNYRAANRVFPPADSLRMRSDSVWRYAILWADSAGYAIEASAPALAGVSCVLWEGALRGHAAPQTRGHRSAPAGTVTCDDFTTAQRGAQ